MFGQVWSEGGPGWRSFAPRPVSRFHGVSTMPVTSVRDVEAHSVGLPPTRLDTQWSSSDEDPLLTVDPRFRHVANVGGQPTVTGEHASQERASAVEIAVGSIGCDRLWAKPTLARKILTNFGQTDFDLLKLAEKCHF